MQSIVIMLKVMCFRHSSQAGMAQLVAQLIRNQ